MFLHGQLKIHVIKAYDLPDTDTAFFNIDGKDVTDPYVNVFLGEARLAKTRYINNDLNPHWDEWFHVDVCHESSTITFDVKDKDHVGGAYLGSVTIQTEDLESADEGRIEGTYDLHDANGETVPGTLELSVQYISVANQDEAEKDKILPRAYFPPTENNRFILYQDAETQPMPCFEGLTNPDGSEYVPTRCWRDLFDTISAAEKFIYITGWSVYTEISLVRGEGEDVEAESNVGELLKKKAGDGCKVMVMCWNEKMSDIANMMGTHDEDTRRYFEGTDVECVLAPRAKYDKANTATGNLLTGEFVSSIYTHHQKTVICDAPDEESGGRRVVAFVGGLDITNGRYDTPEFPLFSTLKTLHKGDFLSNCVPGVTAETGPREPWHDCHAKAEGPIAYDIKKNFEERWEKQGSGSEWFNTLNDGGFADPEASPPLPDEEGGPWTLQLFRSITDDSAAFELDRMTTAGVLHSKGGKRIQNDIMRCMVHQIRNAKNFIYMENQYFLGSAFNWEEDKSTLSHHVVPREIARRIVDKIQTAEDFKAYIVVPMWPEGDPASGPIQEILHWQFRTMESMYKEVAKAIEEEGVEKSPTDYLKFFCLGKRESPEVLETEGLELEDPPADTVVEKVRNSLRHPIYVHSKMTIIDDDYVLVGSANINQRSLGGNRDSEIAVGGFQPDHLAEFGDPRGGVHTYRMALWSAHLGGHDEAYLNPASDECAAKVSEVTDDFWEKYTADEPEHSDVHLLPYPIRVEQDGTVGPLDDPNFPDTEAQVIGTKSGYLPGKLTT